MPLPQVLLSHALLLDKPLDLELVEGKLEAMGIV